MAETLAVIVATIAVARVWWVNHRRRARIAARLRLD